MQCAALGRQASSVSPDEQAEDPLTILSTRLWSPVGSLWACQVVVTRQLVGQVGRDQGLGHPYCARSSVQRD